MLTKQCALWANSLFAVYTNNLETSFMDRAKILSRYLLNYRSCDSTHCGSLLKCWSLWWHNHLFYFLHLWLDLGLLLWDNAGVLIFEFFSHSEKGKVLWVLVSSIFSLDRGFIIVRTKECFGSICAINHILKTRGTISVTVFWDQSWYVIAVWGVHPGAQFALQIFKIHFCVLFLS